MTNLELRVWMAAHGYSVRGLARALGTSSSAVNYWRNGGHPIPSFLHLALAEIARRGPDAARLHDRRFKANAARLDAERLGEAQSA